MSGTNSFGFGSKGLGGTPPPTSSPWADVLLNGNVSGGTNPTISDGDSVSFLSGAFTSSLTISPQSANNTYTLPDATGTILLSNLLAQPNGIATLDAGGIVPLNQLPFSLMEFLGNWDASTNTPTLSNTDVGAQGNVYKCSVAGTVDFGAGNISFDVGDWVVNNGTIWEKVDNTDQVTSVNGNLGAVTTPLADVLAQGNSTGANNISINSGQGIVFNTGAFTGTLTNLSLTANHTYALQDASGTLAFLSDLPTVPTVLNDLLDVTTGLPLTPTIADDGKLLYFDVTTELWITDDSVTFGTVVEDVKTSIATGSIPKGTPVYLAGFDNDLLVVEIADASDPNKMPCIGITSEDINDTTPKKLMTFGKIQGIDTSSDPQGTTYYVAPGGGLTTTRPTGVTDLVQRIAKVLKSDNPGGQLFVFNSFRTAGLPNLGTGNIWVGDVNNNPTEVAFPIIPAAQDLADVIGVDANTGSVDIIVNSTLTGIWKMESDNVIPTNRTALCFVTGGALTDTIKIGQVNPADRKGGQGLWADIGNVQYHYINATDYFSMQITNSGFQFGAGGVASGQLVVANDLTFKIQGVATVNDVSLTMPVATADRFQTFQDADGVIALLSDIAPVPTLAVVLGVGNNTGANDIVVADNQVISTANVTTTNRYEIAFDTTAGADRIFIRRNSFGDGGQLTVGGSNASLRYKVGTRIQELEVGVNNHFLFSDSIGNPTLNLFSNGLDGLLTTATLTASRDWTLPNASGTIALLSDIPAPNQAGHVIYQSPSGTPLTQRVKLVFAGNVTVADTNDLTYGDHTLVTIGGGASQTLAQTLALGNSSGANDISMDSGSFILFNDGAIGKLTSSTLSATQSWELPDETGTIALTGEYSTGATYTISNVTTDRVFNANTTSINELADVLGTLIADLKTVNILL